MNKIQDICRNKCILYALLVSIVTLGLLSLIYVGYYKSSAIQSIRSFGEVDFNAIKSKTLVIFDVDETLIQPTDIYVMNENSPHGEAFKKRLVAANPEIKNWDEIATILLLQAERPLIEPSVIDKINAIKRRGVDVIALTAMNTGPWAELPSMEHWRYEQLKSLGFEGSFESTEFKLKSFKKKPVFYKGILATDTEPKGLVLGEFLDTMHLHPKVIIMFDDSLEFLQQVQAETAKRNIKFYGYHYQRAVEKQWDEKLIEFQVNYLIKNHRWLGDKEAVKIKALGNMQHAQ